MPKYTLPSGASYIIDETLYDTLTAVEEIEANAFRRGLLVAATYIQEHPCTCQRVDLVAGILALSDIKPRQH